MRIGIIGAGAMGGLFGARLSLGGHTVVFIEVSKPIIDAIRSEGLHLIDDQSSQCVWPDIGEASAFRDPFDLLIVFTKGFHTKKAVSDARHLVSESTWVLSVQNGLGNAELISEVISPSRIIVGMTDFPAQLRAPGKIYSQGHGHVKIWSHTGEKVDQVRKISEAFDNAGLACTADPDVQVSIWEKLAFNAALNSICAVSGLTVGGVAVADGGVDLAKAVVEEAASVAKAYGVKVSASQVLDALNHAFSHHVTHKPSMLQDIEAGRQTENDFIAGAIVRIGHAKEVPVPVTTSLYTLVGMKERIRKSNQ